MLCEAEIMDLGLMCNVLLQITGSLVNVHVHILLYYMFKEIWNGYLSLFFLTV